MTVKEQLLGKSETHEPMNAVTIAIAIVIVVLLCVGGLAYSLGWFNWSGSSIELESNNVGTNQMSEQEKTNADAVSATETPSEPATTPAE